MKLEKPLFRMLRVFALDPSLAAEMGAAGVNETTLAIPWEDLEPDPDGKSLMGEYVKVTDQDEAGKQLYPPVDLNQPAVLAGDGLAPSDGNPLFHQQMVYAVAMHTIQTYERSLGRRVHWPQHGDAYTPQITLYPHFEPMQNAFYFQARDATMFGYFAATEASTAAGGVVFTCLSQDIIAHVLSQALLAGLGFQATGGPDQSAFLSAFCDLFALLQRCTQFEFVRHQLARTRGDLAGPSQLGIVAAQFGAALGNKTGLRSAFGSFDETGAWHPIQPNPQDYRTVEEPFQRGQLVVCAVMDALNQIYRARIADLVRIATEGTGVLPPGDLHPDLLNRMAGEATKSAQHVLDMCVRALDYCPKQHITFGDYLRAIITADADLVPVDSRNYRVAFVEAFRRFGIFPANVGTLSIETLLWPRVEPDSPMEKLVQQVVRDMRKDARRDRLYGSAQTADRQTQYQQMRAWSKQLEGHLARKGRLKLLPGIDPTRDFVYSVWPRERVGARGEVQSQCVIEIMQQTDNQWVSYTLLADTASGLVRYVIGNTAHTAETKDLLARFPAATVSSPVQRSLRVFAFDPSLATEVETARINEVTVNLPWEPLMAGPVGDYLEVVDYDPASGAFYEPVDLNHPYIIAQDGLPPSQAVPQFHQQMVYAVAMRTIRNFEQALDRLALWAGHVERVANESQPDKFEWKDQFVPRLRLYPHALREANAFYSPAKKAVLFGYFQSTPDYSPTPVTVFTCLSHDIVAHELTHALLDGMHQRFAESSNRDVLAFHEAFADIVALFQHFSLPQALEHQIATTRGDLASQNRLGELAQEFGRATGSRGALRSAIGEIDKETGKWKPRAPDPEAYRRELEPHLRGSLLVATIFDAFLTIYRTQVADLFRIATKGTGVLPEGRLHPDLVRRLADEAAVCAQSVLDMCIRALDYCPPVDMTFGDYLRACITADYEFDPFDVHNRRTAFIEAFRRHGILPEGVRTYSLEGLLWPQAQAASAAEQPVVVNTVLAWTNEPLLWQRSRDRSELFNVMPIKRAQLHSELNQAAIKARLPFIDPELSMEVHSLRPSNRIDLRGKSHRQWIVELMQWIPDCYDAAAAKELDDQIAAAKGADKKTLRETAGDYKFRGGATLLIDGETGQILYSIGKSLDDTRRRDRQREFMSDLATLSLHATYFRGADSQEPFAVLHRF